MNAITLNLNEKKEMEQKGLKDYQEEEYKNTIEILKQQIHSLEKQNKKNQIEENRKPGGTGRTGKPRKAEEKP